MSATSYRTALTGALLLAGAALAAAEPPPAAPSSPAAAPAPDRNPDLNRAQQLVFMNDLMQRVPAGSTLDYRFTRHGKDLPDYQDRVTVTVARVAADGTRDLAFDFLSGGCHLDFKPVIGYRGNPTPIHFLERDIKELADATTGAIGYFRNRIRGAFAHPAIQPVKITLADREVDGIQIRITPFVDDPNIDRLKDYAHKRYDFLFSEQVPGGLYQIRTTVPAASGDTPLIEEQLTFDHQTPGT